MCVLCCLTVAGKAKRRILKGMGSHEEPSRPERVDPNDPAPGVTPDQRPGTAGRFRLADQTPVPAVDTAGMREIDRIATEETGPSLYQMMENAGRNLAELVRQRLGRPHPSPQLQVLVAAGSGGNGGGGICAARHLANQGYVVTLLLTRSRGLPAVPAQQLQLARAAGVTVTEATAPGPIPEGAPDIAIDAVLGYSVSGAPRGAAADLIDLINGLSCPVISLDIPSGADATTGAAAGAVVRPTITMTLALPKTGLAGAETGELVLADIGIPAEAYRRAGVEAFKSPFRDGYLVSLSVR